MAWGTWLTCATILSCSRGLRGDCHAEFAPEIADALSCRVIVFLRACDEAGAEISLLAHISYQFFRNLPR